jgi:hypothetical protein
MMYALPLENPPLLVVSDRQHIEVHTHFTGTPSERHRFALEDIWRPEVQQRLRAAVDRADSFKPARTTATSPKPRRAPLPAPPNACARPAWRRRRSATS